MAKEIGFALRRMSLGGHFHLAFRAFPCDSCCVGIPGVINAGWLLFLGSVIPRELDTPRGPEAEVELLLVGACGDQGLQTSVSSQAMMGP